MNEALKALVMAVVIMALITSNVQIEQHKDLPIVKQIIELGLEEIDEGIVDLIDPPTIPKPPRDFSPM